MRECHVKDVELERVGLDGEAPLSICAIACVAIAHPLREVEDVPFILVGGFKIKVRGDIDLVGVDVHQVAIQVNEAGH